MDVSFDIQIMMSITILGEKKKKMKAYQDSFITPGFLHELDSELVCIH